MLKAGAKAPSFTLDDMSGGKHSLADILARGPALLVLYKIGCPVCQLTLPFLDRISSGSLQIIAISQDDERGTARFQNTYAIANMETLLDRDRDGFPVSNAFGISHVPSTFLVEPDGTVSLAFEGFVKRELESLGRRAGIETFRPGEDVPAWKAG
jgi:peroxiredoxin